MFRINRKRGTDGIWKKNCIAFEINNYGTKSFQRKRPHPGLRMETRSGISGFAIGGTAKAVPRALAKRAEKEEFKINFYTGASLGSNIDSLMAEAGIVKKRMPYQSEKPMRNKINSGEILYVDQHLSHCADWLRTGVWGDIDYAIIEAVAITEDNMIIPTGSLGNSPSFVQQAKNVIVEINTAMPESMEGIHDVYIPEPQGERTPYQLLIPETGLERSAFL